MLTKKDIDKMIRWSVDTDGFKFAKEIYQRNEPDSYTREKFHGMQTKFIHWVANLLGCHIYTNYPYYFLPFYFSLLRANETIFTPSRAISFYCV